MEEIFAFIEEKIKASGYPGKIDGEEFYDDIADEAEDQEPGSYIVMIKKTDLLHYEAQVDILADAFDLHSCDIHFADQVYHVDFDE